MSEKTYRLLSFVGKVKLLKNPSLKLALSKPKANGKPKFKFDVNVLIEQLLDSAIVGGITFLATLKDGGNIQTALITAGITFLIKLKEYRKISDAE